MNNTQKELDFVNKRFDRDARAFNAIYSDDSGVFFKWFNKNFRKPIFERFDITFEQMGDLNGKSVMDIGCGSGIYLTNMALKGAKKILGIDFSTEMLELAKEKLQNIKTNTQFELKKINFLELDETVGKYDFSVAMGVFDYQPEPIPFLEKMRSVTNEKVIASFPANSLVRGPLRKLRYALTIRGNVYYYDRNDIETIAKKAGFSDFELIPIKTGSGFIFVGKS